MSLVLRPIAYVIGLPEPTLRLVTTVLLGYPCASAYKKRYLQGTNSTLEERNNFILMTGLALNVFFNGFEAYHSLLTIAVTYGLCYMGDQINDRKLAATGVWVFNAVYLLLAYYFVQTNEYDITWTMTQCVLCLRLMGFGFDYYDGRDLKKSDTKEKVGSAAVNKPSAPLPLSFQADTPLATLPPFSEVLAYSLFPSAFLVGPQFSFSLYKKWLNDTHENITMAEAEERDRAQLLYVYRSAILGTIYLLLQQTIGAVYSTSYLLTKEYSSLGFFNRLFTLLVAGKFTYNKYIGIWLLSEGANASYGISYEGMDEEGHAKYGGLANSDPATYETATSIDHIISAFNINTNLWSKYYVFKRLKFLGSKELSQFGTLAFLAIWHGFHSMYFVTFLLEFLYVQCELVFRKRISPIVEPYIKKNEVYYYAWKFIAWVSCQSCITYAVVGFDLLKFSKSWQAYKNVYFLGHLIIPVILVGNKFLPKPSYLTKKKA
ncbi:MBOAT, membrane-bound O-acyltransferase family-domain-containing protein [Pilobolus umbonatus]|nr:MBOAT, membrane-bound O-acyltransferase family-domain-containing protein [Pilobolus umbonatus]